MSSRVKVEMKHATMRFSHPGVADVPWVYWCEPRVCNTSVWGACASGWKQFFIVFLLWVWGKNSVF